MCRDCSDTGTVLTCELGPDVHDPNDDLGCDRHLPCPCNTEESE